RPSLWCSSRPARSRTRRCFVTAGSETSNGAASSETEASPSDRRTTIARRVGSLNAEKTASSRRCGAGGRLTIWLSIARGHYGEAVTSYGALLRLPRMTALYASTVFARLPIGINGIALVLFLRAEGASFGVAGAAAGGLALGSGLGAPMTARLIDAFGVRVLLA